MNARRLPEVDQVLPDVEENLPPRMMFDAHRVAVMLGFIDSTVSRTSTEGKNGRRKVFRLVDSGQLEGRWLGKEWAFSSAHLRSFLTGHDDPSKSRLAS